MTGVRISGDPQSGLSADHALPSTIQVAAVSAEDADLAVEAAIHAGRRQRADEGAIGQSLDAITPGIL